MCIRDSNKDISVKNMKAASDAFERGILIVPATGRSLYTIPKKVLELNCIRYVITSNGAGITDLKTGKSIYTVSYTHLCKHVQSVGNY